jgi:hypothetical protein
MLYILSYKITIGVINMSKNQKIPELTNTILPLSEISKFLQDKRLHLISERMGKEGIPLSYPVLKSFVDGGKGNYTRKTLKYISTYIENYNKS